MLTFAEAARRPAAEVGPELARLAAHGVEGMFIPSSYEESFYRNGNLPEQLRNVFRNVNPARIDEDELEVLCVEAQTLVRSSMLVDDAVQVFYRALGNAGLQRGEIHVRRPGQLNTESAPRVIPPGTAALHAVKRLWAQDWSFDAVLSRLDQNGQVGLEARPTLVLAGPPGHPDQAQADALGASVALVSTVGLVGLP